MDKEYQLQHEIFISNNTGTSPETLLLVNTVIPLLSLLLRLLFTILNGFRYQVAIEIAVIVVPSVLVFTLWSSKILTVLLALSVICLTLIIAAYTNRENEVKQSICNHSNRTYINRFLPFLGLEVSHEKIYKAVSTEIRCHLLLSTAICILAIDFPIFPRHFAKMETYGWGLMDIGVGCFATNNGAFSSQARGKIYTNKFLQIYSTFKGSIPIIIIGIVRVIAVRFIGYHEHVSEYGIHWNFFITLAMTKIICTLIYTFLPNVNCCALSSVFILFYQYLLTSCGLNDYLLSNKRENIVQANKEGIYSLFGYIALYFAGVELGKFLSTKRTTLKEWINVLFLTLVFGCSIWAMMQFVCNNIEGVSRRTANLSYFLWILCLNCYIIFLTLLEHIIVEIVESKTTSDCTSMCRTQTHQVILWNAIHENALFYFLFANVFTGVINICFQTIYASTLVSLSIILLYVVILSLCVMFLYTSSIKTKFW